MQKELLRRFYDGKNQKIALNKSDRRALWDQFIKDKDINRYAYLQKIVPAIYEEMKKSLKSQKNVQTAVFSECVYAQSLAEKLNLNIFTSHLDPTKNVIENALRKNHDDLQLNVRYSYTRSDESIFLVQAGGASGVDCALIFKDESSIGRIELKEPYAKTSEPNLPKYGEDGYLVSSPRFEKLYPQFQSMYEEQLNKRVNAFENVGNNIYDFSAESLEKAVTENYSGQKFAHVICTEDENGHLVMLPANDVSKWAHLEGEIRPSGRNRAKVWTPNRLMKSIEHIGGQVEKNRVRVSVDSLKPARERGGESFTRYKIDAFFYVRTEDIEFGGTEANFELSKVWQLIPSITAKMKFQKLDVEKVKQYYSDLL